MYQVYQIKPDDTLEKIAMENFIECGEICRLNGIDEIVPGSFIVLPKNNSMYDLYVVQKGDTLYSISKKFGVDLDTLYSINGLDDGDYVYPQQEILIPRGDVSIYVTHENESISDLSNKLGIPISEIVRYNPSLYLNSDQLIFFK